MTATDGNSIDGPGLTTSIMCYNEAATLESVVREIERTLRDHVREYEIVIIDDGSKDGSGALADRLARELPHTSVIHHPRNLGLGAVYRAGFSAGTKELLTLFPADGQFPTEIIPNFIKRISGADMVLGIIPELKKGRPAVLRLLSWCERFLYRILFGDFPEFQGIMMFRRRVTEGMTLTTTGRGWAIQMELILRVKRAGFRIVSDPTGVRPRISGSSKATTLRNACSNLVQAFELRRDLAK